MRVPQAAGWNRSTKLDSEIIRFVLVNADLAANQFAPNIVVALEDAPKADVQTIFTQQHANLVKLAGAMDLASRAGDGLRPARRDHHVHRRSDRPRRTLVR